MVKMATPPLILASRSTARQTMLSHAGLNFVTAPTDLDEAPLKARALASGVDPRELAAGLAEAKARAVNINQPDRQASWIIGADQVLVCEGALFDKAPDRAAAAEVLSRLSGRRHELHAAVCVIGNGEVAWRHVGTAELWMRRLSAGFIDRYLDQAGRSVLWSVGCYQIEGLGAQLFERIEGDHFTIQGLPLLPLLAFLRRAGLVAS